MYLRYVHRYVHRYVYKCDHFLCVRGLQYECRKPSTRISVWRDWTEVKNPGMFASVYHWCYTLTKIRGHFLWMTWIWYMFISMCLCDHVTRVRALKYISSTKKAIYEKLKLKYNLLWCFSTYIVECCIRWQTSGVIFTHVVYLGYVHQNVFICEHLISVRHTIHFSYEYANKVIT